MPEVYQHLSPLADLLAHGEYRAPVGEIGVVEGWFEGLVLEQHTHVLGHRLVGLREALLHAVAPLHEGVLAGVVGAVGEPQGEHVRSHLAPDIDALQQMLVGPAAHHGVGVADASELVVIFLKKIGVYGPDAKPQALGMFSQFPVVVDPVPGDVYGHRGADAGEAVDLGGVRELLERVAGDARLREHLEARAGVTVAPRRRFQALGPQALLYPVNVNPPGREGLGKDLVGPHFRALQSFLLLPVERRRPLTRGADTGVALEVVLVDVLLGEDERRPEKNLVLGDQLDLAETTGLKASRLGQVTFELCIGDVHRQVAEVDRVPEDKLLYGARLEVGLHVVRGREAGDGHLALEPFLLDGLGRTGQGHGGYPENAGCIGVRSEVVLGYIYPELQVLLAGLDGGNGHLGVLFLHALAHRLEPGDLVRGSERSGNDQELALAAGLLGHDVNELVAYGIEGGLVDEDLAGVLCHVGVPGRRLDPGFFSLLHGGGPGVGGVGED